MPGILEFITDAVSDRERLLAGVKQEKETPAAAAGTNVAERDEEQLAA